MPIPADKTKANLKRNSMKETEILLQINEEISQSQNVLSPWKDKLVKYNELYMMVQRSKHYGGLSNIFVPETLRAVETIVAKLYQVLWGSGDFFEYTGRDENDQGHAIAMTQLVRYQMDENKFKIRCLDSLRQMVISGLTVRKIMWDFREVRRLSNKMVKRIVKDPMTGEPREVRELQEGVADVETCRDHWTFEPVDLLGFHISDVATPYDDIQRARWIAEEYFVDDAWVQDKARKGFCIDFRKKLAERQDDQQAEGNTWGESQDKKDQLLSASGFDKQDTKRGYHIIERWGLVPCEWVYDKKEMKELELEEGDLVEGVVLVVNGMAIAKLEANPFWHGEKPYVSCPYIPKGASFDGMGAAQIAEKLQEELNDTRNQTMDNKTLILMNMWVKHRGAGIKNADLKVRPLGIITTNMMDGLEALRPPILTGTGVNIENIVKEDLRQSVGASSNLQGIAQGGVDTATESSIINKEALGRLLSTGAMFGELVFKPMLVMAEYMNYQFMDRTKTIKIIGARGLKYRTISREDLTGYKDVIIHLTTDLADNPSVRRQQYMSFITTLQSMPPEMIAFHWKALNMAYGMFFEGRELSEIYDAPPGQENLLTPEQEVEMVLAEQMCHAKPGQDHKLHIKYLEQAMADMKYALTPESFDLLQQLIMEHHELLNQELEMAQQQLVMQSMAQEQNGPQGQKGAQGGDRRKPNSSPYTQTPAPSEASITRATNNA